MQVTDALANRNSEDEFRRTLFQYSDSGIALMHVRTGEIMRTVHDLRKILCTVKDSVVHEWNVLDGTREINVQNMRRFRVEGADGKIKLIDAMRAPGDLLDGGKTDADKSYFYIYVNPHSFMNNNPGLQAMCENYAYTLPASTIRIIYVTPDEPLPESYHDIFPVIEYALPSLSELRGYLDQVLEGCEEGWVTELSEENKQQIVYTGVGMTKQAFEAHVSLSIVANADGEEAVTAPMIQTGVSAGKTEIVRQSDILELTPAANMEEVGGMERLKEWVSKRRDCFSDGAREFGIKAPKGIVCVGPPGTGKSLSAKAVASEFGVPLLRFDFGRVFNSLVGSSEQRMRTALKQVESMAPCVLFCDEIDKGLAGLGGSGDSGTSQRVFGTFLTWLQENKAPVFTMCTANNIWNMPPEMMRRGRFDAIFASSLPNDSEREAILRIHLKKVGHSLGKAGRRRNEALTEFINVSNGYVGSEIEAAVQDGLVEAYNQDVKFTLTHAVAALQAMVPLSKSYRVQIVAMVVWAQQNATPAGAEEIVQNFELTEEEETNVRQLRVRNFGSNKKDD